VVLAYHGRFQNQVIWYWFAQNSLAHTIALYKPALNFERTVLALSAFNSPLLSSTQRARTMAYGNWRKADKLLFACRVVGLAIEALFKADVSSGEVRPSQCGHVEFWKTQELGEHGHWSKPKTCVIPVLPVHQSLAFYILQRIYQWLAGLGLSVVAATVPK